ncbi:MAG: OFA family MFS transporter [Cyanobacteria bacterium J06638_22]
MTDYISTSPPPVSLSVFGMPAERGRWLFIPLGMTVMLCLGTVYSWSVFRKPLESDMGLRATESVLPYTFALVFYSVFIAVAGFYISRIGVRRMTAIGGVLVGLGYVLSSFTNHIMAMSLTYGAIAGTGVGIAYGVPMLVSARWFPDRKGLAVGLTLVGFGLSPIITAPLANILITSYGVRPTLRLMGIVFALIILGVAIALKLPPQNWYPNKTTTGQTAPHHASQSYPPHMLKSRSFYGLWICYTIGTLVGLSAIGISSPVGEELIQIDPALAAGSVSLFALFNGGSRPLFGWLSDRFKPHYVAIASYSLILVGCIIMLNAQEGQVVSYLVAFCLFWFCLGGWLAIAPTTTLRFFNPDHYAQNYGIVFTAYGVGALLGTLVTGQIRDWFGSYTFAFYPMAFLAIVGIVVASVMLRRDRAPEP